MARLLNFSQFVGGADNVIVSELTPSNQKKFSYDFETNVSSYTFTADYRTILVDAVTYDRQTGLPNFADSTVLGYFGTSDTNIAEQYIDDTNANIGRVNLLIPADRYTGSIMPDSRNQVPITVVTFRWASDSGVIDSHRHCILERWEPDIDPGQPSLDANFIPIGVGAIKAITDNVLADSDRINQDQLIYTGLSGLTSGEGTGATFEAVIDSTGDVKVSITNRGTGYNAGDTITILDSSIGNTGAADITVTVSSVG